MSDDHDHPSPAPAPSSPLGGSAEPGDLTSQVDSLLRDIESSAEATTQAMADPPPASAVDLEAVRREAMIALEAQRGSRGEAAPAPIVSEPAVSEPAVSESAASEPRAIEPAPASTLPQVPSDLLGSVQAALQADPPVARVGSAANAQPSAPSVSALDEQIAASTEEVLASEPEAQPVPTAPAAAAAVAAVAVAKAVAAPTAPPAPVAASAPAPAPAVAEAASVRTPAAAAAAAQGKRALGALEAPLLKILSLISKPLENKPPMWRDSVGYLAASTLFFGAILWAHVIVRAPADAHANAQPFDFATSGLPKPEEHEQDAHAAGDAHGGESAKGGGHGSGGEKGGGGGGHGEAKPEKGEAKKPVLNSTKPSVLNQTIQDAKKAAKKDEKKGGGGHH